MKKAEPPAFKPLAMGDRVYVTANSAPQIRSGCIVSHDETKGGYLVLHDSCGLDTPESTRTFGWCYDEVSAE